MLTRLRAWVVRDLPLLTFLGFYFLTVVLGNLLYLDASARDYLGVYNIPHNFADFAETFTAGYWALLFLPFILTPLIANVLRRRASGVIAQLTCWVRDPSFCQFACVAFGLMGWILYFVWHEGIYTLYVEGATSDFERSVAIRFAILDQIGFTKLIVVQGLLPYLCFFATIQGLRGKGLHWQLSAIGLMVLLSFVSIVLNMKWPVLLFLIGIVLCIFCNARRYVYLKTFVGGILVLAMYVMVSNFALHMPAPGMNDMDAKHRAEWERFIASNWKRITGGSDAFEGNHLKKQMLFPINRMASSYPYYYHVFTSEGAVCGGVLEQASSHPPCRPSTYIYSTMFGADGFEGRGTSPQGVHITGYALGGWPLALVALAAAATVIGLLMALPYQRSSALAAFYIFGGLGGYHFSQVPGEGVIFYPHGLLWPVVLMLVFSAVSLVNRRPT